MPLTGASLPPARSTRGKIITRRISWRDNEHVPPSALPLVLLSFIHRRAWLFLCLLEGYQGMVRLRGIKKARESERGRGDSILHHISSQIISTSRDRVSFSYHPLSMIYDHHHCQFPMCSAVPSSNRPSMSSSSTDLDPEPKPGYNLRCISSSIIVLSVIPDDNLDLEVRNQKQRRPTTHDYPTGLLAHHLLRTIQCMITCRHPKKKLIYHIIDCPWQQTPSEDLRAACFGPPEV
jgi:hypothetical protein